MNFDYNTVSFALGVFASCLALLSFYLIYRNKKQDLKDKIHLHQEIVRLDRELHDTQKEFYNLIPAEYLSTDGLVRVTAERQREIAVAVKESHDHLATRLQDLHDLVYTLPIPPKPGSDELPQHPRICQNCQHFIQTNQVELCRRKKMDLVTGTVRTVNTDCKNERKDWPGACGPDGRYFIGPEGMHTRGD